MDIQERIMQLILEAIEELNETLEPEKAIEKSPDCPIIGGLSKIDSLTFVNLAAIIEDNVEEVFKERISLIDLIFAGENRDWTVSALAKAIAPHVNHVADDQPIQERG